MIRVAEFLLWLSGLKIWYCPCGGTDFEAWTRNLHYALGAAEKEKEKWSQRQIVAYWMLRVFFVSLVFFFPLLATLVACGRPRAIDQTAAQKQPKLPN